MQKQVFYLTSELLLTGHVDTNVSQGTDHGQDGKQHDDAG